MTSDPHDAARTPHAAAPLTPHARLRFVVLRADAREHELATQRRVAQRLAELLGCRFEDAPGDDDAPREGAYVVPNDTITSLALAHRLGIRGEADLFGGVVPLPFMATKAITHPLVRAGAAAPAGWSDAFARRVEPAVLPGRSAFSADDARAAGRALLPEGPVRLKLACGTGGSGQRVARDAAELDAALDALDAKRLASHGVVVEPDLADPRTWSIGLLRVGALTASYFGTQCTTLNRHGEAVYGGSSLTVVRGGFDDLARHAAGDAGAARAVALARVYHEAALACFAGMFASRSNYDVVEGCDARGRLRVGVLEQSWRIGGASGAEVAALAALRDDASLPVVRASTVEVHGPLAAPPAGATVYYAGVDPQVGPITKYAEVHAHADPRAAD